MVGQAMGGVLYAGWGAVGLLLFDALSFAYGGAATWLLPRDRMQPAPRLTFRLAIRRYAADTVEGMVYVRNSGMTVPLLMFAGVNCLFMPVFVLLPIYTLEVLGGGPEWYGFLLAGSGFGALIGSVAAGVLLAKSTNRATMMRLCVFGVACCVLLLAAARPLPAAFAACVALGVLTALINVTVITTCQSMVPPELRGRVMALVVALSTVAVPLGMGLGGVIGEVWRESLRVVFACCGVAIAALTSLGRRTRHFGDAMH
jgi:predicted MFS family arabinose efflux permease